MERTCKNCSFCKELYYKYCFIFLKSDMHYCENTCFLVTKDGVCGKWRERVKENPLDIDRLKQAEEDVLKIKEYLNL